MCAVDLDLGFPSDAPIEGYIGMALVGGAAALGTLIIAALIKRTRR